MLEKNKLLLTIELNKKCNVNCENCYIEKDKRLKDKNYFDINWVKKISDNETLKNYEYIDITLYGGEISILNFEYIKEVIREFKTLIPKSRITIVSNFFNLKDKFIELYIKESDIIETTFDFSRYNLNNNKDVFLKSYKKNFEKIVNLNPNKEVSVATRITKETVDFGISNFINYFLSFELNNKSIINLHLEHGIDFQEYNLAKKPKDILSGYPIFKTELNYEEYKNTLLEIKKLEYKLNAKRFFIKYQNQFSSANNVFILSFSSEGDVTINPIFTDLSSTFIGNLKYTTIDEMLSTNKFKMLKQYEKKRLYQCLDCEYFEKCLGGPLFLPKNQLGINECVGFKSIIEKINK